MCIKSKKIPVLLRNTFRWLTADEWDGKYVQKHLYMNCGYSTPLLRTKSKICTSHKNQTRDLFLFWGEKFFTSSIRVDKEKGRKWLGSPFKQIQRASLFSCWVSAFGIELEAITVWISKRHNKSLVASLKISIHWFYLSNEDKTFLAYSSSIYLQFISNLICEL